MSKKQKYLYTFLIISTVVLVFMIIEVLFFNNTAQPTKNNYNLPTPTIESVGLVTPTLPPQESLEDVTKGIDNKKPLNAEDEAVRAKLKAVSGGNGIIFHTDSYNLRYAKSADVLQVQILTTNVNYAIAQAIAYLQGQGMTSAGICNLPLVIYRDPKAFDPTLTAGMEFYPIPLACQK